MVSELVNRSRPFVGGTRALGWVSILVFIGYVVWSHLKWHLAKETLLLEGFFGATALLVLLFMISGIYWRSFTHLAPASGRVLAIVPCYNEDSHLVHAVVRSLLRQSILPDEIHVVDDGSAVPLETFDDPLVTWHHVPNGGKRHAQAHVLQRFTPNDFDFVFTVDSDSVVDDDALEHLLRAMRDERVQAATGMILMRNWNENLLTRLTDINVVTSCLVFRMLRSWFGVVSPTSGALALYRSRVIYDNLYDYLHSGTVGDDRRMSFYALLRGQVVGVTESVVCTELPSTWHDVFMQRMRWSKSAWLGVGFVMTNLPLLAMFFYVLPLVFCLIWPFAVSALVTLAVRDGNPVVYFGLLWWVVCSITQTALYSLYRPGFTTRQRWLQFALSPVYPLFGLLVLRPAAYWALTKLRSNAWHTREVPAGNANPVLVERARELTSV